MTLITMQQEGLHAALVEGALDAVVVIAHDGQIVLVNQQAEKLFGYERDELLGKPVEMLVPASLVDTHRSHRAAFVRNPAVRQMNRGLELTARRRDGSEIAVEVGLRPLQTDEGSFVAAQVRDVSSLRAAQESLRVAQAQLQSAFDNAPIGMALIAPNGSWIEVNRALCRMSGYAADELLRLRFQDITHPDDVDLDRALIKQVLEGELPGYQVVKRYIHRDRHTIAARLTVSLVKQADGRPSHFICQLEDITHQRTLEEGLRESRRQLQAMLDNIPAGLSMRDLDGRYLLVNAVTAASLGSTREALVGRDPEEYLDGATREAVRQLDVRVAAMRRPIATDVQLPHADGTQHDYHVVRYPVIDDDGTVTAFGAFALDVTQQRQTERTRAEALADLAAAQRLAAVGSWRWDPVTDIASWSDEMYRIFGRDHRSGPATGEAFFAYLHPDDRDRVAAGYAQTFGGGPSFVLDYRVRRPDGTERVLHARGRADDTGGSYSGTVQDVTELRDTERRLSIAEERFQSAFEHSPVGMAVANLKGEYELVNPALCELTGYSAGQLLGRTFEVFAHPDDRDRDWKALAMLVDGQLASDTLDKRYVRGDGEVIWVTLHVTTLRDADGNATQLLIQVLDITEKRRHEEELRRLADHDPLTGLLNRRGFERLLDHHLSQVARYGDRGALLMLDLDNFKALNDALGHAAGDEVLRTIGAMLTHGIRDSDVAARVGGDEFVVLLTEAGAEQAEHVASDLVRRTAEQLQSSVAMRQTPVTMSVGCVQLTPRFGNGAEAVEAADAAMYQAKGSGRNRYVMQPRSASAAG